MTPRRRLLTSLAQFKASTNKSLLPPYSHKVLTESLKPPYQHLLPTTESSGVGDRLNPRRRFTLVPPSSSSSEVAQRKDEEEFKEVVEGMLGSLEGRGEIERIWKGCLEGLERGRNVFSQIPQIASHSLAAHLTSPSTVDAIKQIGMVVVRDVIPDEEAINWAKDILQVMSERNAPVYWDQSLLAARSNPSLIACNDQLVSALSGDSLECYIRAEGIQEGLGESSGISRLSSGFWDIGDNKSILAHLCLTPPQLSTSPTLVHPTINSITYKALRPYFTPQKSRISFYDPRDYLQPFNWILSPSSTSTPNTEQDFPHLTSTQIEIPPLNPGDIIYRHPSLPIFRSNPSNIQVDGEDIPIPQIYLPVTPLLPGFCGEFVKAQREAFEDGLPPPHVRFEGESVVLEERGRRELIGGFGGRRVMGY